MNEHDVKQYITDSYFISEDRPFEKHPDTVVYRHPYNKKWFAIVMPVTKRRLGIDADGSFYIINVKTSIDVISSFVGETGFFPAYHMNKSHWISIALDGSVPVEKNKMVHRRQP